MHNKDERKKGSSILEFPERARERERETERKNGTFFNDERIERFKMCKSNYSVSREADERFQQIDYLMFRFEKWLFRWSDHNIYIFILGICGKVKHMITRHSILVTILFEVYRFRRALCALWNPYCVCATVSLTQSCVQF